MPDVPAGGGMYAAAHGAQPRAGSTRVLCIDGGGVRGLIPAVVLADLERRSGRSIARLFDVVAGTSTGAILAVGLAALDAKGLPRHTAEELRQMYHRHSTTIFARSSLHRLRGVVRERYSATGLEGVLSHYLGDLRLSDIGQVGPDVLVPTYDLMARRPYLFDSRMARADPDHDYLLRDVVRAAAAAPTYFEPAVLEGRTETRVLIDGGLFANNPGMCAFAALGGGQLAGDMVMVSIGTGSHEGEPLTFEHVHDWGIAQWFLPMLSITHDGLAQSIDEQLAQLLGPTRYHRLQAPLGHMRRDLDDPSPEHLADLDRCGVDLVTRSDAALEEIVELLVRRGPPDFRLP